MDAGRYESSSDSRLPILPSTADTRHFDSVAIGLWVDIFENHPSDTPAEKKEIELYLGERVVLGQMTSEISYAVAKRLGIYETE